MELMLLLVLVLKGSEKIQGIMLDPPQEEKVNWSGTEFEKMKWLRILIVRNTSFSSELQHLPNHLKLLDWENYPSKSFPPKFHPKKIVVFNLPRSCLTFQDPFKVQSTSYFLIFYFQFLLYVQQMITFIDFFFLAEISMLDQYGLFV